jgi:predicted phosphodiesterase
MVVYCSSDWHCGPKALSDNVRKFLDRAVVDSDLIIGNGDLFDVMREGLKSFVDCPSIRELKGRLQGKEFIYVTGNHDPEKYVRRIIEAPHIKVVGKNYDKTLGNTRYRFVHGYHWGLIWSWLQYLCDLLILLRAAWVYNWWVNKVNSARQAKYKGEKEKYDRLTGHVHRGACKFAEQEDMVVIVGHTHKPWAAGDWEKYFMYDDGDMLDSGTYLRIEDDKVERLRIEDDKVERLRIEDDRVERLTLPAWQVVGGSPEE